MPLSKRTFSGVVGGILGLAGLSAVAGLLVTATVTPAIALSGYTASGAITMFENIPADLEVDQPMLPTTIYTKDDHGKYSELTTFYDQNRIPLEYKDLPQVVVDAVLSSEDPRFYDHGGVDLFGTGRAILSNAAGGTTQGASTISQQFVKNVLVQRCEAGTSEDLPASFDDLTAKDRQKYVDAAAEALKKKGLPKDFGDLSAAEQRKTIEELAPDALPNGFKELTGEDQDRYISACYLEQTDSSGTEGYQRKLQEMRYAIAIEKKYTKEEILVGYLNIANFGGQTYGIEAASERYLNKKVKDLNVGEAATLAGIVQNPNQLRLDMPGGTMKDSKGDWINTKKSGYAATEKRRNYVLNRMLEDGKITEEQHDKYHESAVTPDVTSRTQGCQKAGDRAYFCEYVRQTILNDKAFGDTSDARRQTLSRGGLKIYTTLNPKIQEAAEDAIHNHAPQSVEGMDFGSTVVTVDPKTGDILAMAQNTDYSLKPGHKAGDGYTSLVYSADANHGNAHGFSVGSTYKLFTLLDWLENGRSVNESVDGTSRDFSLYACGKPLNPTSMRNFGGIPGRVSTPMDFTAASLNTGFMAMAEQLDVCEINRVADRLGVTLGNGGKVTKENYSNNIIGDKAIAPLDMASAFGAVANKGVLCDQRAISKAVDPDGNEVDLPKHDCKRVIKPEVAATAAYALQGVMDGGSGTGGNPYDGTELIGKTGTHQDLQTMLVESSTRATTAGWAGNASGDGSIFGHGLQNIRYEIAKDTQRAADAVLGSDPFPGPDDKLTRVVRAEIPTVRGMSVSEATSVIEDAGFNARVGDTVLGAEPQGTVERTDPGGSAPVGSVVLIRPSDGRGISVPEVRGMSLSQAQGTIQAAGLNAATGSCQKGSGGQQASGTSPGTGNVVGPGTTVVISYTWSGCGGDDRKKDDDKKKDDKKNDDKKDTSDDKDSKDTKDDGDAKHKTDDTKKKLSKDDGDTKDDGH